MTELEAVGLVRTTDHTLWSTMYSSRICPRISIQIGMGFTCDEVDFLIKLFVLLSLAILRAFGKGVRVG